MARGKVMLDAAPGRACLASFRRRPAAFFCCARLQAPAAGRLQQPTVDCEISRSARRRTGSFRNALPEKDATTGRRYGEFEKLASLGVRSVCASC